MCSRTSVATRVSRLEAIIAEYKNRSQDIAEAIAMEMGCPISMAATAQVGSGIGHLMAAIAALRDFRFEERIGDQRVVHEPTGALALIRPRNWPMNQVSATVAPDMAACTGW